LGDYSLAKNQILVAIKTTLTESEYLLLLSKLKPNSVKAKLQEYWAVSKKILASGCPAPARVGFWDRVFGVVLVSAGCGLRLGWVNNFVEKYIDHPYYSKLPIEVGDYNFRPPSLKNGKIDWNKTTSKRGGLLDESGNLWTLDKGSVTGNQNNLHFDVQLKDGSHKNINPNGTINHGN
jgi:hypothetical protein